MPCNVEESRNPITLVDLRANLSVFTLFTFHPVGQFRAKFKNSTYNDYFCVNEAARRVKITHYCVIFTRLAASFTQK